LYFFSWLTFGRKYLLKKLIFIIGGGKSCWRLAAGLWLLAIEQPKRLFICTKEISRITVKGRGASLNLINKIREKHKRPINSDITVIEFCEFVGLI